MRRFTFALSIVWLAACTTPPAVEISGDLAQWHKVTLTMDGPEASETGAPNPFTDYRMAVRFAHESGDPAYDVPGYFAADGNAAETSADAGNKWRAHLSPDKEGRWTYAVSFASGPGAALDASGEALAPFDGVSGEFTIGPSAAAAPDFRARGRLEYVGKHHLRFAGSGEYFLKAGPDAPETFLAYSDFDNTTTNKTPLKSWEPHVQDWREGDPVWQDGKGKGVIGALNYLAEKGMNAFSFLTYNAGGDGDNIWPFIARDDKMHYDVSKLDQWGVVFEHAQSRGIYLHFKLQENELDDNRIGQKREIGDVPTSLDNGALGPERKLYVREIVARYGHNLALNWNLGEENTQSTEEQIAMAGYIGEVDPYDHNVVVHTFPNDQDQVYSALLGKEELTGASLQNPWDQVHQRTLKWIQASAEAGHPWVCPNDEQNPASQGVPPDPGYEGYEGVDKDGNQVHTIHDIRKYTLWGNLMAGGAGVEYYFGYQLPQNDLIAEDWRSRDISWDYCRRALDFFEEHVPFWETANADALVGNPASDNSRYALAKPGEVYVVFLPSGGSAALDLAGQEGEFSVQWFDPRNGGDLQTGSVQTIEGGGSRALGNPPSDPREDWAVLIRKM